MVALRPLTCLVLAAAAGGAAAPSLARGTCATKGGSCSYRHLNHGVFTNRDLSNSRWVGAHLERASFRGTNLFGATFRKADLKRADLSNGNRTKGNYSRANMFGANLIHSTFAGSRMRYANLEYAHLNGTTMDDTDLTGADLTHADLRGSSFYRARLCHTIQPNGLQNDSDCSKGGGGKVSGSSVNLPQNIPTRGGPLVGKQGR